LVAHIPESQCLWPAASVLEEHSQPGGRPRRFPPIADPQAQPLSATAWRAQAEAGTRQGQKVTRRLPQPKPVPVARIRVRETIPQAWRRPGPERWLLIERHRDGRCKGYVSNAPRRPSGRRILHGAHQRGKIEPSSQQLKEELGLDHFDGRSWRGLPPIGLSGFWPTVFCHCSSREKKELWSLPAVRRWLNRLFRFTHCPHSLGLLGALPLPLFSSG